MYSQMSYYAIPFWKYSPYTISVKVFPWKGHPQHVYASCLATIYLSLDIFWYGLKHNGVYTINSMKCPLCLC